MNALEKICKNHLSMVRTFEQRSLIEEGKFVNKTGIYMVFEDFCGFYQNKKKPLPKIDAFGKEIIDEEELEGIANFDDILERREEEISTGVSVNTPPDAAQLNDHF